MNNDLTLTLMSKKEPISSPYLPSLSYNIYRSTTVIRLDTEYSILRWTEYPPDANHGLYVGSAVLSLRLPADNVANATVRAREDSTLSYLFLGNIIADPVIQVIDFIPGGSHYIKYLKLFS